jgi:tRNA(Ile)-lysidine synthase
MSGPPAAVAAVRVAVRRELSDLAAGDLVLVACSGGADSMALLAATVFEAPRAGLRAGAVTVDHCWTTDSTDRAAAVVAVAKQLGADPAEVLPAPADRSEDAARRARYAALDAAATRHDAAAVLLAHSLDDQAETVLLGLARGSGARSLAGMPGRRGIYRRPLLGVRRALLRTAAEAEGLEPWDDPANADRAFMRARIRHDVLPLLEEALGPGVTEALARTAALLGSDADALEGWAAQVSPDSSDVPVDDLLELPPAVRSRAMRAMAIRAGAPASALSAAHVDAIEQLVSDWHGQGAVALPGGVHAARRCGRLVVESRAATAATVLSDEET